MGIFDPRQGRLRLAPVLAAFRLQVRDLHGRASAATDRERLVDRLKQRLTLAADMAEVDSVLRRRRGGHGDQLIDLREHARCVDQTGGQAESPLVHCGQHCRRHPAELRCRRASVLFAHGADSTYTVTHHGHDVDRGASSAKGVQVVPEALPCPLDPPPPVAEVCANRLLPLVRRRRG